MMHDDERILRPNRRAEHGQDYRRSCSKKPFGEPLFAFYNDLDDCVWGKNAIWKTKVQQVVSSILNSTETHRCIPLKSLTRSNRELPGGMQITTETLKRFKIFLFVRDFVLG